MTRMFSGGILPLIAILAILFGSHETSISAQDARTIELGGDELTAGIPGDGPLTTDQIRRFVSDSKSQELLSVKLPLGLAVGQGAIFIPADNPLTRAKIELGRQLFFDPRLSVDSTISCSSCHHPDFGFGRNTQFGVGMNRPEPDLGRFDQTKQDKDRGAFKTPTVRNVTMSAPYMHDGSQKTLEEVVEWYDRGGHPNPHLSDKIKKLNLTPQEKGDLVEFMKSLTGAFPKVRSDRLPQ